MNDSIRKRVRIIPILFLACLVLSIPLPVSAHKEGGGKPLKLEVNGNGDALITKQDSKCTRGGMTEKGCLKFKSNTWDIVKITLKRTKCSYSGGESRWKLDGVQLGDVDKRDKPADWANIASPLDARAVRDFNADNTGWIKNLTPDRTVKIKNRNASATPYSVWYRVRATCEGENPIYLDPRFENEGNP